MAKTKATIFDHYGNKCVYCGSTENLQIDHMNGNGAEERRQNGDKGGTRFYQILKNKGLPPGYQTVCRACNSAKQQMTDQEFRAWIAMMYDKLFCSTLTHEATADTESDDSNEAISE